MKMLNFEEEKNSQIINKALKLIRTFHGCSQTDLAEALAVSNSFISEIESGKKNVTLEFLKRFSEHFKIPMSSIILFSEHMEDSGAVRNLRFLASKKIIKLFEWIHEI